MDLFIFSLDHIGNIIESDSFVFDSNIIEKLSHVTISSLVDVCQNTIFELCVLLESSVGRYFILNSSPDYMLVSEDILDL